MIENINNIIRNWLQEAAQICRDFPCDALDVSEKAPGHCVTALDFKIDAFLKKHIRTMFPDHNIISEEGEHSLYEKSPYTWLLDPIDGTSYLIKGINEYSVVVMLLHHEQPIAVGIINPETNAYWIGTEQCFQAHILEINRLEFQDKILTSPNYIHQKNMHYSNCKPVGSIANRTCLAVSCDGIGAVSMQNLALWDVLPSMFIATLNGYAVTDINGKPIDYVLSDMGKRVDGLIVSRIDRHKHLQKWINDGMGRV